MCPTQSSSKSGSDQLPELPTLCIGLEADSLARRVLIVGWVSTAILAAADFGLNHFGGFPQPIRRSFNIAREDSIGTWFAVVQLVAISIVAALIFRASNRTGTAATKAAGKGNRIWLFFSLFFLYLSIDDLAEIHERLGSTFADGVSFFPSYAWQVVFAPLFGVAGVLMLYLAWRVLDSDQSKRQVIVGLALLVVGVVLDFGEGIDGLALSIAERIGWEEQSVSHTQKVAEESIEMAGMTLFLAAFLRQLATSVTSVAVSFVSNAEPRTS